MSIKWVGAWAVDGQEKLMKLPRGGGVCQGHSTVAEEEFYKEILRLRERVASAVRALDDDYESSMSEEAIAEALRQLRRTD